MERLHKNQRKFSQYKKFTDIIYVPQIWLNCVSITEDIEKRFNVTSDKKSLSIRKVNWEIRLDRRLYNNERLVYLFSTKIKQIQTTLKRSINEEIPVTAIKVSKQTSNNQPNMKCEKTTDENWQAEMMPRISDIATRNEN